MSAHVLLNSLNELGKRDKMRGLPSILSLFGNEFNKSNNTRARMLRFYLSYDIRVTLKPHFCRKRDNFVIMYAALWTSLTFSLNLQTTSGLSILLHSVISLPDATSYNKICFCLLLLTFFQNSFRKPFSIHVGLVKPNFSVQNCDYSYQSV